MLLVPPVLPLSLLALVGTVAIFGSGLWLVYAWFAGIVAGTGYLVAGLALLAWTLAGRWIVLLLVGRHGDDDPRALPGASVDHLRRPDGAEIQVVCYGPADAPPVVLTHGWGTSHDEWYYLKRALAGRFRLITWDLRGIGGSTRPPNHDYRLETMAQDLEAVLEQTTGRPVVL